TSHGNKSKSKNVTVNRYDNTGLRAHKLSIHHHHHHHQQHVKKYYVENSEVSNLFNTMVADEDTHVVIHVRYVSKDLWVKIELPRNITVYQAKDLIFARCQIGPTSTLITTPASPQTTAAKIHSLTGASNVQGQVHSTVSTSTVSTFNNITNN